MIIIKKKR